MKLSILVCTLTSRHAQFNALHGKLVWQVRAASMVGQVEVLCESDAGQASIGDKRNRLIARAGGDYVCFVDDDDDVDHNYVQSICAALRQRPDCVGIKGIIWWHGKWMPFTHSTRHKAYTQDHKGFYRPPNHLNPVRRDIARGHPFTRKNHGEDTDYAVSMCRAGVLKTEAFIDSPIYIYRPAKKAKRK